MLPLLFVCVSVISSSYVMLLQPCVNIAMCKCFFFLSLVSYIKCCVTAIAMLLSFTSAVLPYLGAISMPLVLASAVSLHWSANMLLIKWQVLSSISSEAMPASCPHCGVKCWYAILKQSLIALIVISIPNGKNVIAQGLNLDSYCYRYTGVPCWKRIW